MTSHPDNTVYEFGVFRLDPKKRLLLRDGEPISIQPKALALLIVMVERHGQVLEKDELMMLLWPDTNVEEANLSVNMSVLRRALGEGVSGQRYVVTIPGRGYRFVANVKEVTEEETNLILERRTHARLVIEQEVEMEQEDDVVRKEGGAMRRRDDRVMAQHSGAMTESAAPYLPISLSPRLIFLALALFALVVAGGYFWIKSRAGLNADRTQIRSIAVLPFRPLDGESGHEYLGLGLADALITRLSRLNQIIVRPTSAVRQYAKQPLEPVAAGQALKVEAVLEGSIRREGEHMRVTVQLIGVKDGAPLWAAKFDEKLTDILTVEDAISEKAATALALHLGSVERELLTKRYTQNTAAYQAYLQGRYFWDRRTPAGYRKGIEYFEQAIALDQNYALAWAGLADCYVFGASPEGMTKARDAALKALRLDEHLAEAHTSLAFIKDRYDWDRAGATQSYRRALELNPNYAVARDWYGLFLAQTGQFDAALAELKRAQELDPLSLAINFDLGFVFLLAGRTEQAITQFQKPLEIDPEWWAANLLLSLAYTINGNYQEAQTVLNKLAQRPSLAARVKATQGFVYVRSGRQQQARQILAELTGQAEQKLIPSYETALLCASLGERDQAFAWLGRAYEARHSLMVWLKVFPGWESLRDDPRFVSLLRKLALES